MPTLRLPRLDIWVLFLTPYCRGGPVEQRCAGVHVAAAHQPLWCSQRGGRERDGVRLRRLRGPGPERYLGLLSRCVWVGILDYACVYLGVIGPAMKQAVFVSSCINFPLPPRPSCLVLFFLLSICSLTGPRYIHCNSYICLQTMYTM